jgi:pimeloyl-ACP methyl ester carboxylesterase
VTQGRCVDRGRSRPPTAVALAFALALCSCATPGERLDAAADAAGFTRRVIQGTEFRHVVYLSDLSAVGRGLHVFIDGDGTPYDDRWTVSADPTPRRPLMLQLMQLDRTAAAYVGRPCYAGLSLDPPCTPLDWTLERYGPRVVASMASVIQSIAAEAGAEFVELHGHSGGGTLAVLIAPRLPDVRRVVTLAANLDTDAWADLHGYARLAGSLNPVEMGPLPATIEQRHYAGEDDRVVPPALVEAAALRIGSSRVEVLPGVTHHDGWDSVWPAILAGQTEESRATSQRNE